MENASKALIISGAILIALLLISFGVVLFTNSGNTLQNGTGLTENQKITFNSKFQKYEGSKTGSEVKEMIKMVNAINNNEEKYPEVKFTGKITNANEINNIVKNRTYNVTLKYNDGLVSEINISE